MTRFELATEQPVIDPPGGEEASRDRHPEIKWPRDGIIVFLTSEIARMKAMLAR